MAVLTIQPPQGIFFQVFFLARLQKCQFIHDGLKFKCTHQYLVYDNYVNILGGKLHTIN